MKRCIVVGMLIVQAGHAAAQSSVRLYGILDAGIDYTSAAAPSGGSLVRLTSGGSNTSRWGLRGREDLGGGLSAVFQLEGTLLLDAGAADGPLFKRQANVGLEGGFGRVVVGRSFTTVHDLVTVFDPLALAQFYSWTVSASAVSPNKYGYTTSFDNMVKYLGRFEALQVGLNYGFGEQPGSAHDSARGAMSLCWCGAQWSLMATWEQVNGNVAAASGRRDVSTVAHAGAIYQQGAYKWMVVARSYKLASGAPSTADVEALTSWAGLNYTVSNTTLTAALYHVDVRRVAAASDPTMLVLGWRLALSPQTDLYSMAAYSKARNGQLAGVLRDLPGYANSQRGLVAGIQYRF
ncbi:porin [Duganella sp. HH101]|uniref:porin n=1 Tax=Duganella sp. HH101 TaxID=1781066 RepID=UPI000874F446|nr:porin [Duganella sp. HH101]OFA03655.1 outer membrane porin protein 32 precursor [Duganella sp. HH101]